MYLVVKLYKKDYYY